MSGRRSGSKQEIPTVDWCTGENIQQVLSFQPLLCGGENLWHGIHLNHQRGFAGEVAECYSQQHLLVTHLSSFEEDRWIEGRFEHECLTYGESLIIPQEATHRSYQIGEAEAIFIAIEPEFLTRVAVQTFDREAVELIPQFSHLNPLILQIVLELKNELAAGCPTGLIYGEFLANTLAAHLLKTYCVHPPKSQNYTGGLPKYKLQRAIDYINDNLEEISLQAIANELQISLYHFARLFKQSMGLTPHQYVTRCRIEKAKLLLDKHDIPIADICQEVGFQDQSHFTVVFRKLVGTTPKLYQKR